MDLTSRAIGPDDWIAPLKHVEGHTFRRVRSDDGPSYGRYQLSTRSTRGREHAETGWLTLAEIAEALDKIAAEHR